MDGKSIIIGSINMYKFSANTKKELSYLWKIIEKYNVDILAIQEIFSKAALDRLLNEKDWNRLNWDGRWASPNSKSVSAAEGYAFVWNKKTIELSKRKSGNCFEPVIHNQYPHKEFGSLIRNPFYGRFTLKNNERTEIRLINIHIMFSSKRSENEADNKDLSENLPGAVMERKREYEILASKILPKIDNKDYDRFWDEIDDTCRRPITILLGDYNLNLRESGAKDTFIDSPVFCISDGRSEKKIITVQDNLSTLKADLTNAAVEGGYKNNFDHFTYDEYRSIETKCWAVDAPNDPELFGGDYQKYKDSLSDHLMIIMKMTLT